MLKLAEELLLLAFDEEKGTLRGFTSSLGYALAGALLMELTLKGKLDLEQKRLVVVDATPTGDELLDEALMHILQSQRARSPQYWVNQLSYGIKNLRSRLLNQLLEKGILRREEHRVLRIIPTQRYPAIDTSAKREVRSQIRAAILYGDTPIPRMAALISLVNVCELVNEVFFPEERKLARSRIKEIMQGDAIGQGVVDTVNGVQSAMMTAVIASTTASVSASCSGSASHCH